MLIQDITAYLDGVLNVANIADYCPNGLQIQGSADVKKIISGVSACQLLIERAIAERADMLLVHHGFFWKDENQRLIDIKYFRIAALIKHDINLLAYHLPVDMHNVYGNNVMLAQKLAITLVPDQTDDMVFAGTLVNAVSVVEFIARVENALNRKPLYVGPFEFDNSFNLIRKVAICSGGAESYIHRAYDLGVDAFITGEISEKTVHIARELGLHLFAAGHHATERYGIQALGDHLAEKFKLEHKFIDIANPI
jgi:dinuclear metal center YbgI/SA1388 family protein